MIANKLWKWASVAALGLAMVANAGDDGVDTQEVNVSHKNRSKEVTGQTADANNPIKREIIVNTEGVIVDAPRPDANGDGATRWRVTGGGEGKSSVVIEGNPSETVGPGDFMVRFAGRSRIDGGEGQGNPTYDWSVEEKYTLVDPAKLRFSGKPLVAEVGRVRNI
ncbi:MAG: hypothetical protein J6333_07155 [Planctomycetes bacterium]|nr:hypothetical protein [Planctomycetota bacterium]